MTDEYEIYKEGGLLRNRYKKIDDISEGSYGYVSLANDVQTKKLVAVKHIFKNENDDDEDDDKNCSNGSSRRSTDRRSSNGRKSMISEKVKSKLSNNICFEVLYEVDIHHKVGKHKNITELYDFFDSFIIMEYCSGGDLYEAIKADYVPRKTKQIIHIASQIMEAVQYVHRKGIYHRDIKPENILISGSDWTIKLTDWGLATTDKTSRDRSVGSERYMAPELFKGNLDCDEENDFYECDKVDIWAIGIVLLNVVFHKNPFSVANQTDKSFCYFAANREALFDVFSTMSYDFFQVLRHSLTIDPTNRNLSLMQKELLRLGEFTLDDEFYNKLTDEEYTTSVESGATPTFTSTTPTVVERLISTTPTTSDTITPSPTDHKTAKEKDPVPRFRFRKRSHPAQGNLHKNALPIKIDDTKIIRNSRKPLAIPTPNTHINNYFNEYKSKQNENFKTRDFFTPPSVQNRYMEGIFNGKSGKSRGRRNSRETYKKYSFSGATPTSSSHRSALKPNTNHLSPNGARRGSHLSTGSTPSGKYVPPHSRPSSFYGSPKIPNITSVLESALNAPAPTESSTFHEKYQVASDSNDNDLDDVLFTLEENDLDGFATDIDGLSLHGDIAEDVRQEAISKSSHDAGEHDVPDLLRSPVGTHQDLAYGKGNPYFNQLTSSSKQSMDSKPKSGVYVPPHQRKERAQAAKQDSISSPHSGATLSVSQNSISYGSFNSRRFSNNHSAESKGTSTKGSAFVSRNHGKATTVLQQDDIFAESNALVFEDDSDYDEDPEETPKKSWFGPHQSQAFSKTQSPTKIRTGRKSSSIQDDLIGSLEQYKNNWLMLQQQQD
ncbi:LAMI_0C04214g1_1 [Lachancea mirantina]|uniref:non-specific serine/threonine protein kinase n=1 Tax=Lachancea mirantina TaxID=1230905 RepID=A0A1G4J288_9SACH|nr:LAMI_0C04214g1_1 [Lachancea mirantina]